MTYAIGRPAHLPFTGIRAASGLIHIAAGWNFRDGTRTWCGRTIKFDGDYFHLYAASAEAISETFETGRPCERCLGAVERGRDER